MRVCSEHARYSTEPRLDHSVSEGDEEGEQISPPWWLPNRHLPCPSRDPLFPRGPSVVALGVLLDFVEMVGFSYAIKRLRGSGCVGGRRCSEDSSRTFRGAWSWWAGCLCVGLGETVGGFLLLARTLCAVAPFFFSGRCGGVGTRISWSWKVAKYLLKRGSRDIARLPVACYLGDVLAPRLPVPNKNQPC